jgi:hypothetical protein
MSASWGWALAVLAVGLGYVQWGWQGVVLAATVIVFWLLLQFSRALRIMRQAAGAPVGHVDSAVMLHARLRPGMRLMEIIPLTRSLGEKVEDPVGSSAPSDTTSTRVVERFRWRDGSSASVTMELRDGRLVSWELTRPENEAA